MSNVRTGPPSTKKPSPWGKLAPLATFLAVALVALVIAVPAVLDNQGGDNSDGGGSNSGTPSASPRTRAIMRDCRAQLGDVPACARLGRDADRRERYVICRADGLPAWRCLGVPQP